MYGAAVWGPGLADTIWPLIERPQVLMISRMIRSKPSVPHDIVRAELAVPPMLVEALFQTVCLLHRLQSMHHDRIAYRALQASQSMALAGDTSSWYAQTSEWFTRHGLDIDRLPPLQYDIHAPTYNLTRQGRNRIIRQEISRIYIERTWISPGQPLPTKMLHYHEHFLQISDQGFIDTPQYMQQYMPHHLRVAIGQLRVSSHQLEIERGRARGISREDRTCPVCQTEVETEEHFMLRCPAYSELRQRFGIEGTLQTCMRRRDQTHVGQFIIEALHIREESTRPRPHDTGGVQQTITQFFQRVTSRGPTPPMTTGLTLQQAEAQRARRHPRELGYRRPRLYQQEILRIHTLHEQQLERARSTTHWSTYLHQVFQPPPPMYHILYPLPATCY